MKYLEYEDYLQHWGIKGMKWGVRRFRNKDDSLTAAGKKRYDYYDEKGPGGKKSSSTKSGSTKSTTTSNAKTSSAPKKSKHQQMLEEEYQAKGASKQKAEQMAKDKIRAQRVLMGMAGLTVAACAAYAVSKHMKYRTDGIIKAGEVAQRIEMQDTGGKLYDVFYMAKGKHDSARYKGLLGMTRQQQTGQAYLLKLQAKNDIKVASQKKAVETFGELYKNDADFRSKVAPYVKQHFGGSNKVDVNNLSNKNLKKMYENFNSALIDMRTTGADKTFYNKLKESGYGAIQDINDMKFSGYQAKNPLIVFDNANQSNIMVSSVRQLTKDDKIVQNGMKELGKAQLEKKIDNLASVKTAAAVSAVAAGSVASDYSTKAARDNYVKRYKEEHPNSKLSDAQIAKQYYKSQ